MAGNAKRWVHDLAEFRVNSSLGRKVLSVFYKEGNVYRVRFGPNRGRQLLFSKDLNYHMLLGLWDVRGIKLLQAAFADKTLWGERPAIIDVGANVGYMSLLFSRGMEPYEGQILGFEASPSTYETLEKNIRLNALPNVEMVQAAVADRDGSIEFHLSHHHHSSSLIESWANGEKAPDRKLTVRALQLDTFLSTRPEIRPALIKLDIEGGGVYAIPGMMKTIGKHLPLFYIESHTPEEDVAICSIVKAFQYSVFRLDDLRWATEPTAGYPNPNGVRGTMLLTPPKQKERIAQLLQRLFGVTA